MSNRNLEFAGDEGRGFAHLQREVVDLVAQLNDGATAILVNDVVLASGVNKLLHHQAKAPRAVAFVAHSTATAYPATKPDATFLYLTASGAVTGDLFIWL